LAREYPIAAVTLDICLPDINGWRVLRRLKQDLATRHIPVYVVSTEEECERARTMGSLGTVLKPLQTKETLDELFGEIRQFVERPVRNLLVIEPNLQRRERLLSLIGNGDVRATAAGAGREALDALEQQRFDCIVFDVQSGDGAADALIDHVHGHPQLADTPLILYSEEPLLLDDVMTDRLARSTSIRHVQSPDRLLDEVSLVLHRPLSNLAEEQRNVLERLHQDDAVLNGKRVLIVDDDIRNIFALTSVLERYNMHILTAETGRDAIQILQDTPEVDAVLMDIMMPEFDGLDTTRAIREIPDLKDLPIIAVTAKAMKGDREKCIEAGAWDYLSKPVDPEKMLAVLRAWIRR
jgi:CheY-like chemotaxis protein